MVNNFSSFDSITHLDGRNQSKLVSLRPIFSEKAWNRYRLQIMCDYLKFLVKEKIFHVSSVKIQVSRINTIKNYVNRLTTKDCMKISQIEVTTNHDLKALEIFFKEILAKHQLKTLTNYVNLGLGSEDINNIALRLQVQQGTQILFQEINILLAKFINLIDLYKDLPMLARTHGQVAAVTSLGKELAVYLNQIVSILEKIKTQKLAGKISGEVGNFNALTFAFPKINCQKLEIKFLQQYNLTSAQVNTQIAPYIDIIELMDNFKHLNSVLISFSQNIWIYAMLNYLKIKKINIETGSAGMPHKINPKDFEGAEGGLEMANGIVEIFARKLLISRLQRDFSDSTIRRNFSLVFAYSLLSYQSLNQGLSRLTISKENIQKDLEAHFEVMSEILTTILKLEKQDNSFELIKQKLRGRKIEQHEWKQLIKELKTSVVIKQKLENLIPDQLIGKSIELCRQTLMKTKKYLKNYA